MTNIKVVCARAEAGICHGFVGEAKRPGAVQHHVHVAECGLQFFGVGKVNGGRGQAQFRALFRQFFGIASAEQDVQSDFFRALGDEVSGVSV